MRPSIATVVALLLGVGSATISRAEVMVFLIRGQFAEVAGGPEIGSNLPPEHYPVPDLLGGSFEGQFIVDNAVPAAEYFEDTNFAEFNYTSVDVRIRDRNGNVIHRIDSGPNRLKINDGEMQAALGLSFGPEAVFKPEDLRLFFTVPSLRAEKFLPSADTFSGASFAGGFSETDGRADFTYWDVAVTSASIAVVPEASTLALHALGLLGLGAIARRRCAKQAGKDGCEVHAIRRRPVWAH